MKIKWQELVSNLVQTTVLVFYIEPSLVRSQISKKISEYEKHKTMGRIGPKTCGDWIEREQDHYAKVRIVKNNDGYRLVYGDELNNVAPGGTGPFKTLEEAQQWFLKGGR